MYKQATLLFFSHKAEMNRKKVWCEIFAVLFKMTTVENWPANVSTRNFSRVFWSWKFLPVCLTSSFISIKLLWVSVCLSLQLCQWLVTVTRCSVWSVFLSAMNPCNHGRGPLCTMNVCCQRCAHTHSHTQSHTHKLSPHPMGNRADHVRSPPLSLPQFSRICRQWHTLVHVSHARHLARTHTHIKSPFLHTHQI